jgi:hypothetical protein
MANAKTYAALILPLALASTWSARARAEESFWSKYNLGVSYGISGNNAQISYNAPIKGGVPSACTANDQTTMQCIAYLGPDKTGGSSVSVFLDEPFKRQGLFYFDYGLTFATESYEGGIISKPGSGAQSFGSANAKPDPSSQPLTQAYMDLYGVNWQTYIRFGITPMYIPDVLVTAGVGLQTVGGPVKIYNSDTMAYVIQPEAFGELSLVVLRVGTGYLSAYYGLDQSITGAVGTQLVGDNPGGTPLTNLHLALLGSSEGIRLLFPF